jgi:hypothetical protein
MPSDFYYRTEAAGQATWSVRRLTHGLTQRLQVARQKFYLFCAALNGSLTASNLSNSMLYSSPFTRSTRRT